MSSWGTISLHQELPREYSSDLVIWNTAQQPPVPSVEVKQRPEYASEGKAGDMILARDLLLEGLEQKYVIESRPQTEVFLRFHPTAIALLFEASAEIDRAFGEGRIKAIRLVNDDVEGASIFGIVFWPESAETGVEALARFDQNWWLRNCYRASGVVNFNIELA